NLANTQVLVDVTTFSQFANAYARNEKALEQFYFRRFRSAFRPAVTAWIATNPLRNPKAPLTPFAMPQYRPAAVQEANRLSVQATQAADQAKTNNQRGDNYVLALVLFAISLFFAGIGTHLRTLRDRRTILALGCLVFVGTVAWISTFPVSFGV